MKTLKTIEIKTLAYYTYIINNKHNYTETFHMYFFSDSW